ncbi:MAG: hypothetical protein QOE20_4907 [Mycobacterium sp.]|nr:hypothetical protein [Mycobacterium sp.]
MAYVRAHDTKANARGRVVKRYEVVYRVKVRTEEGRTVTRLRQETHPTKAAAEARAAELNARKHRRPIDPAEQRARGNRTFDEWAGDWLDAQQTRVALGKLKQRTAEDYGKLLNRYVLPELGAIAIADVDALAVDQFMARLSVRKTPSGAPLHPKTIKHAWNALRWVLAYASRKDAIEINPIDKTEVSADRGAHSTGDHEDFAPHPLTGDELGALCAALRGEYPAHDGQPLPTYPVYALMVEFMANTGLRGSDVSGLEIADLTTAPALAGTAPKASVRVVRTKTRKGGDWVTCTPKSRRSANRVVPLPGWLAIRMADYLATHPRGHDRTAPLWPGRADQSARAGQALPNGWPHWIGPSRSNCPRSTGARSPALWLRSACRSVHRPKRLASVATARPNWPSKPSRGCGSTTCATPLRWPGSALASASSRSRAGWATLSPR